jgi:hypothetical protein
VCRGCRWQRAALVVASLVSDQSTREATLTHPVCEIVLLRLCQLVQADLKDVAAAAAKVRVRLPVSSHPATNNPPVVTLPALSLAGPKSVVVRCRGPETPDVSASGAYTLHGFFKYKRNAEPVCKFNR